MFETVVRVDKPRKNVIILHWKKTLMDLIYSRKKTLTSLTKKQLAVFMLAHTDGDVPNMYVTLPGQDAFLFGYAIYFFGWPSFRLLEYDQPI